MRPHPGHAVTCGVKLADAERLQNLLRDAHFFSAIAARSRRKRNADGIADALLQQNSQRGAGRDDAFCSHAGFGQPEMQRIVATSRQ